MKRHNVMLENKWKKRGTIVFAAVGLVSAYLTYQGLRGVTEAITAALLTLVSFIFQMTMWSLLMDAIGRVSRQRQGLVELAAAVTIGGIAVTSTLFSWTGMAGPPSQTLNMAATVDEAEDALGALRDEHCREQQLAPVFAQTAGNLARVSTAEQHHGALSGRPSRGPITTSIDSVSASYADVSRILDDSANTSQQRFDRIEELLKQMRELHADAVAAEPGAVQDISRRFAAKTLELNELFDDIATALPTMLAVVRQADAAIKAIPTAGETSPSTTVANLVGETNRRVEMLARDHDHSVRTPAFKPLSQSEAAWAYLPQFPSFAVYCLFFDLVLPLAMVLAAMIFSPPRKEEREGETLRDPEPTHERKETTIKNKSYGELDREHVNANGMSNRQRVQELLNRAMAEEKRAS